jgi:hypothetical protein
MGRGFLAFLFVNDPLAAIIKEGVEYDGEKNALTFFGVVNHGNGLFAFFGDFFSLFSNAYRLATLFDRVQQ